MTVATQKLWVPSPLARPAEKGCPRKRRGGRTEAREEKKKSDRERGTVRETGLNERRSSKVVVGEGEGLVPRVPNTAVSGGPTVQ